MKTIFSILCLVMALAFSVNAQFPAIVPQTSTLTNVPTIIETAGVSNINAVITLFQERNVAILPYFAGTNAGTANLRLIFDVSVDGSNWSTHTIEKTCAMTGTTGVRGFLFLTNNVDIAGVKYIRLKQLTNAHTASLFITNVTYSFWP